MRFFRSLTTAAAATASLLLATSAKAQDDFILSQDIDGDSIEADVFLNLDADPIKTIHKGETVLALVSWEWTEADAPFNTTSNSSVFVKAIIDGEEVVINEEPIDPAPYAPLPTSSVVEVTVDSTGFHEFGFVVSLDPSFPKDASIDTSVTLPTISSGTSLVPLILVLVVAILTQKVELALFSGVLCGACIINGDLSSGFKASLDTYILGALTNGDHQYVILFTFFLSGLVGLMDRAGGIKGLTTSVAKIARSSRLAQFACFIGGFLLFFDDYTSALVLGQSFRPVTDLVFTSREKLAFIVDATSAPMASISPISSWVGFEVKEIQKQLDKIIQTRTPEETAELEASGFVTYLISIPYRFYPLLMLVFQCVSILTKRDFGPMLIAERKTQVYQRTDGGDGAVQSSKQLQDSNKPKASTPAASFNFFVPLLLLVFLIVWILIMTGVDGAGAGAGFEEIIRGADSYSALLYGTFAASVLTLIFYIFQFTKDGSFTLPTGQAIIDSVTNRDNVPDGVDAEEDVLDDGVVRPLITPSEGIDAWLKGLMVIFSSIVVLVLAWSAAAVMENIGSDRLFSSAVQDSGIEGTLPAITFSLSAFMAICLGSSWSTMGIMYPLTLEAAFVVATKAGNINIFYAVVGSILSGAVAGDHSSPISDTTVLSSTATSCDLFKHVVTQMPYAVTVFLCSLIMGYLPVGLNAYAAGVGLLLGSVAVVLVIFLVGVPVLHPTGRFDPLTELYIRISGQTQLKEDTAECALNGGTLDVANGAKVDPTSAP